MPARFIREDIAQFEWKHDPAGAPPGEGHVFVGTDTLYGHEKVWFENWRGGKKHGMCSFRIDELSDVIAALKKAKAIAVKHKG